MPLGGFAPCPLPLGGTALDGVTAEQHARLAADLKAAVATAPFAVYGEKIIGGSLKQTYISQHGNGTSAMPLVSTGGVGVVNFDWNLGYSDEYDVAQPTNIRHAQVTEIWTIASVVPAFLSVIVNSPTSVTVYSVDSANAPVSANFTLVVW